MVNKVILVGNLGKDPQSFGKVTTFSLGTSEKQNGEDRTEWHQCKVFGKTAEYVMRSVRKGDKLYVEGKKLTDTYEDKSGNEKSQTYIYVNQLQRLSSPKSKESEPEDYGF